MRIKKNKNVRKGYDNLIILSLFKIAYGVNLLRWHFDDLQYAVYSWCSLNISMLSWPLLSEYNRVLIPQSHAFSN